MTALHVHLVEGGQHGGGVLRFLQAARDGLAQPGHLHALLARASSAGRRRARGRRRFGDARRLGRLRRRALGDRVEHVALQHLAALARARRPGRPTTLLSAISLAAAGAGGIVALLDRRLAGDLRRLGRRFLAWSTRRPRRRPAPPPPASALRPWRPAWRRAVADRAEQRADADRLALLGGDLGTACRRPARAPRPSPCRFPARPAARRPRRRRRPS